MQGVNLNKQIAPLASTLAISLKKTQCTAGGLFIYNNHFKASHSYTILIFIKAIIATKKNSILKFCEIRADIRLASS